MSRTLLVATDGQAIMRSHDDGKKWYRLSIGQDLEYDDRVRCLLLDPKDPNAVFAGAETGLFYSRDCGVTWSRVDCALNDYAVWKLAVAPSDPNTLYAGTGSPTRSALFRSRDGGKSWEPTSLEMPERCQGVSRPRMLALCVDPDDPLDLWVGVEEGGLFRTQDGGDSWTRIDTSWPEFGGNSDLHDIVIIKRAAEKVILALTVIALYRSTDDGKSWTRQVARESWGLRYSRCLLRKPGHDSEIFVGIGDGTPGTTAAIMRSADAGETWTETDLPPANSCIWGFGANSAEPEFLLAATKFGYLYRSADGGRSWRKEWREFNEITDLLWMPGVPADLGLPHVTN
jgi:photosystem II stability/assembly factor-like uncharacterized protein